MTILYPNPCYNEVRYERIALYMYYIFSENRCCIYDKPLYVSLIFLVQKMLSA